MSRSSRADAERNRTQVVDAASQLFRERGTAVGIPELMASAGLTHGAFYRHFASKDELTGIAATAAFEEQVRHFAHVESIHATSSSALTEILDEFFATGHRDAPGSGCASTGLASDAARAPADGPLRAAYVAGTKRVVEQLANLVSDSEHNDKNDRAIIALASMVGALTLARATAGDPLSETLLATVKKDLLTTLVAED